MDSDVGVNITSIDALAGALRPEEYSIIYWRNMTMLILSFIVGSAAMARILITTRDVPDVPLRHFIRITVRGGTRTRTSHAERLWMGKGGRSSSSSRGRSSKRSRCSSV
jgi:hypothetical protein